MDKIKALDWELKLTGSLIGGFEIVRLIDHGKSAAVFLGQRDTEAAAIKIFDDELLEKYGDDTQIERIKRELTLVGHTHPNLVKILGGGVDAITNSHYVIMEFLDGPNLATCLQKIPTGEIPKLVEQLASAAKFLEDRGVAHRDIKPENIVVLENYTKLVLLDLGVLRPIGRPGVTDDDGIRAFVGTLQYSSPEFLLRKEHDTIEGWRALTFYQIGGVLHDLIVRKPLFEDFMNPYARLVMAVQSEVPIIQSAGVPPYLIDVANNCLLKIPELRIRFVTWNDFSPPVISSRATAKEEIAKSLALSKAISLERLPIPDSEVEQQRFRNTVIHSLKVAARTIRSSGDLPPIKISKYPQNGTSLRINLASSAALKIPAGLHIYISVEVLDLAGKVISLKGCTSIQCNTSGDAPINFPVFEGVFNGDNLFKPFEDFIYRSLIWAKDKPASSIEFWPLSCEVG